VRAGIGDSADRGTSTEDLGDLILGVVQHRHPETRFEIGCEREIERKVDGIDAAFAATS